MTGGLSFFGGPGNNYVTHSVAAMVDACRVDPGSRGLVTGVGYFDFKHGQSGVAPNAIELHPILGFHCLS